MLQKLRAGDIDFVITVDRERLVAWRRRPACSRCTSSSATRTISTKALADKQVSDAFRAMIKESVQGAQVHRPA